MGPLLTFWLVEKQTYEDVVSKRQGEEAGESLSTLKLVWQAAWYKRMRVCVAAVILSNIKRQSTLGYKMAVKRASKDQPRCQALYPIQDRIAETSRFISMLSISPFSSSEKPFPSLADVYS